MGLRDRLSRAQPLTAATAADGRALTAAAQRVDLTERTEAVRLNKRNAWQADAWVYRDAIGEVRYALDWLASIKSRLRLYVGIVVNPDEMPTPIEDATAAPVDSQGRLTGERPAVADLPPQLVADALDALSILAGGGVGHGHLLHPLTINMEVPGEALDIGTLVATPTGFTRMGDLVDGDEVLGGDGRPCRVIKAHPVRENRDCYLVEMTGGVEVIADADHLWTTHEARDRQYARAFDRAYEPSVRRTTELADTLRCGAASNHAVELTTVAGADPVDGLPIDPYLLGYWLGDGTSTQGNITVHHDDQPHLREQVEAAGYRWSPRKGDPRGFQVGILGLQADLRAAGLLGNKHVPRAYLRASEAARWALLQGLIDSDGHVDRRGDVEFSNTNEGLLWDVVELAASLGLRPGRPARHRVRFCASGPVARLPRKAERVRARNEEDRWRFIKRVEQVKSRPVRCITVDSPDSTFLVTHHLVRTHNCYLLGLADLETGAEEWSIRSMDELQRNADGTWRLLDAPSAGTTAGKVLDPDTTYVARLWNPHPRWHALPDSPMRGVLDPCETLLLATRKQRVRTRQRLMNGLLAIPDTLDFDPEPGQPATPFMQRLTQLMVSAVSDESSAASLAPAVIRGPKDDIAGIQKVDLVDKDDDDRDGSKVEKALSRIGRGLDVPPEVIEGLKDVKFANAVAIDSTGFRYHIEPKAQRDADALTQGYLWERLLAQGHPEEQVRRLVIWYDPTEVVTNPNRLPDTLLLHKEFAVSDKVLRDAAGYGEDAAPEEEELLRRLSMHSRTVPDGIEWAILALLAQQAGIELPEPPAGTSGGPALPPAPADSAQPALPSGETQQPDAVAASAAREPARFSTLALQLDLDLRSRVTAAADAAMRRALERAGARVVSKAKGSAALRARVQGVPTIAVTAAVGEAGLDELGVDVDTLLAGAFDDLAQTFGLWATATWEQGLRAACDLLSLTYYPPESLTAAATPPPFSDADTAGLTGLDQIAMRNAWARNLAEAQQGLVADLAAEARRRLFSPTFTAPTIGEHDPSLLVRPGTVRRALATAGGASSGNAGGVDSSGRAVVDTDGDAGYVVTGHDMTTALTVAGVPQYAYRWVWGGSARPFPEHQALDGRTFADQSDSALAVPDAYGTWLPGTSYFPGDHDGCQCSTERLVEDPFIGMDPAESRRVRAAQKARGADGRFVRSAVE